MSELRDKLQKTYPATPEAVTAARKAIVAFARGVGVPPARLHDVSLATSEALTNAVQHAYIESSEPGAITVTAMPAGSELWILIADAGRGLRPRCDSPGLGLGLGLMTQIADRLEISHEPDGGTEIRMTFPLATDGESAESHPRAAHRGEDQRREDQRRGSRDSASRPASSRFSTIA